MKKINYLLIILILLLLSSCKTYTARQGLEQITYSEEGVKVETRYRVILQEKVDEQNKIDAEKQALEDKKAEEERIAEEQRTAEEKAINDENERKAEEERLLNEQKLNEELALQQKEAEERALRQGLEKYKASNPIPSLDSIVFPHVYKPQQEEVLISDTFTLFDVLLLPLGNTLLTTENILTIANSISDIEYPFIFITGSLENQVNLVKALDRDSVILENGSIAYISTFVSANKDSATFLLSENKQITLSSVSLTEDAITKNNFDISSYKEYINEKSDERISIVNNTISPFSENASILALSSSEPSDLDWSAFTDYNYRNDYAWPLSISIRESGYTDTYRATHYSEETDPGITLDTQVLSERVDFLYSKGLMNVSSSTLSVSGLSNNETVIFAVIATYILP